MAEIIAISTDTLRTYTDTELYTVIRDRNVSRSSQMKARSILAQRAGTVAITIGHTVR